MDLIALQHKRELDNKRKSRIVTIIVHAVILLLIFLPFLEYPVPAPGPEGVLVSFGQPEAGSPAAEPAASEAEEMAEPEPEPEPEPEKEVIPIAEPETEKKAIPIPTDPVEDTRSEEIAIKKKEEREKLKQELEAKKQRLREEEAERKRIQDQEAERKRQEEAEAERIRQEEARKKAERDKILNQVQDAFNQGDGTGGENDKPGTLGNPEGKGDNPLSSISSGSGKVGGGLANRGGVGPKINDSSQYEGIVIVRVCVNARGQVVSAKYTAVGSTTSNATLIRLAEENANKWSFKSGSLDKQCGTITYDFKVK